MKVSTLRAVQKHLQAQGRDPRAAQGHPFLAIPNRRWVNAGFQGDRSMSNPIGARQFDPRALQRSPMARQGHPASSIPDSRWVNAGLQGFGYDPGATLTIAPAFCSALKPAMADLGNSLQAAYAANLQSDTAVVQGANVFDSNKDFWSREWVSWDCSDRVKEVVEATNQVNNVLRNYGVSTPPPSRPNYDPVADSQTAWWLPWAIGGAVVLVAASIFSPYLMLLKK